MYNELVEAIVKVVPEIVIKRISKCMNALILAAGTVLGKSTSKSTGKASPTPRIKSKPTEPFNYQSSEKAPSSK